jgi:hypothetical protein
MQNASISSCPRPGLLALARMIGKRVGTSLAFGIYRNMHTLQQAQ